MTKTAKFSPAFESLTAYECPKWFRDAKFGIWSHWGPQSVPMYGDWYARNMYIQGHKQYLYHLRHYGHPSKFGYKDICALWQAENFDPEGLMALYKKAGARYFVGQAMHHDHFFNYPSRFNRFNSVEIGPKKDICGLWKAAADREGLPFGLTEHLGATFSWWKTNKWHDTEGPYAGVPYDGNDPEYRDFYLDNYEHVTAGQTRETKPWLTSNRDFHDYWLAVMREVIDLYQPDLLYSDSALPFGNHADNNPGDAVYRNGLEAVAHLYNTSIRKHGENRAVYNQKDRRPEVYRVGVLDIEKSQLPGIYPDPWQTDTCIGNWFYDVKQEFKKPGHVIEMLIDIAAKNGCMLLNILQKPDGSIDDETHYLLSELADWFAINSEAIHGTRPWRRYGEGDSTVLIQGFKEEQVVWNSSDYRFTRRQGSGSAGRGDTLYAFMLAAPENRVAVIKSLTREDRVRKVTLLGGGECAFSQAFGTLTVELPERLPSKYTNTLAIDL
ncbi:MAG: alpha-L-fucosidase [Lentisphaeria bacterium]|nr:alpha-L-fucosidase [Lentisphaeria bacterium]